MELNYVVDITSAYNDVLMKCGEDYQVQRYTHGIDEISMDFWMLDDHDNGWIPGESDMNLSEERERLYYLHDELGSITKVIGENGKTSAHYNYDEFGVPKPSVKFDQNWPGPDNTFGYTGYQYDTSAELWYAQARYYMPETGRFISEDPWSGTITTPTTMNPYPYVLNNPLKYVDPLGLQPEWSGCPDVTKETGGFGPTLMEAAEIADHVYFKYSVKKAKEEVLLGDWQLEDVYQDGSLRIGIYTRITSNETKEYVLANRGTQNWDWNEDGDDNILQIFGASKDMENSISYAKKFVQNHSDAHVTFVGHSKGGAEAAANAVATTNKNAILI